ncbi:hypothetical protein [Niabella aurantiaca]|uniref:hypothetical protein n=1 Tax=Niabella aurantiaca TaxID=379900 RepID=UPI00036891B8|nr:hypothetical protein [Niabella aurantiaca]
MQGRIDPANCEAYFLLYVDNELSNTERAAVEAFLQQHPETGPLLEALMRTRQDIDPLIVFPDRSKLFFDATREVTDDELLSYLDKETVPETVLEKLQHPSLELAKRLQAFEEARVEPEMHIVFPDKTRLYRNPKLIAFRKWGMAAAAVVVIAVGATIWMQDRKELPGLAGTDLYPDTASGAAIARALPDAAPADTLPSAGNAEKDMADAPAADYRDDRTTGKRTEKAQSPVSAPLPAVARHVPDVSEQPPPASRKTEELHQPAPEPLVVKQESPLPAATAQDPSAQRTMAMTGDEKQSKAKKSLFKKLTRRIEERVTETLTDNEGQVNIAGFAVNVK